MINRTTLYVLDTDICVYALRHDAGVKQRFAGHSPEDLAITTMTEAELYFGARKSKDPVASRRAVNAFLAPIARFPFDSAAAERHAEIRDALRMQPIGDRDLVVASTAIANSAKFVTHNLREFSRVAGLDIEDWMEEE